VLTLGGNMFASTVYSGTGSFSAFPSDFSTSTPTWISGSTPPATNGMPFWNNPSDDTGVGGSHLMNIGYALTDSGGLAGTPSVLGGETVAEELTAAGGADPERFSFLSDDTDYNISLLFADSSLDTGSAEIGTVFGYYVGSTFTPIWDVGRTDSPTGTEPFDPTTPGNSYGFYATVCYSLNDCETYTTGEGNSGNSSGGGYNHFALFELNDGNYVIGFTGQNGSYGEGLGDFNDVVIELQAVPEPGTIAIAGLGLAGMYFLRTRRRLRL
jgi:hypothetical protein